MTTRAALAATLAALLAVPLVLAASPGARPPVGVDGAVNEVAIAANGRFAAASADPEDRFTGDSDVPVWNLWNVDGSLRQSGSADPAACDEVFPGVTEDCRTHATRIALSGDGSRIAVASDPSGDGMGSDFLSVFNDAGVLQNDQARFTTPANGVITDVAISQDGSRIAVGADIATQNPGDRDGLLQVFDGSGRNPLFSSNGLVLSSPVRRLALSPDGDSLVVAAGANHYFKLPATVDHPHTVSGGSATDVSISAVDGWSVAGYDNGFFGVYSEDVTQAQPRVYQKKESGADGSGLIAVAIRPDADAFVTGSSGGTLRYYRLDRSVSADSSGFVTLVDSKTSLGQVRAAAFSGDSRYLAVRTGSDTVRLYSAGATGLTELWKETRSGGFADSIAIDARGEHVVAATGSSVIVYDARHSLVASTPAVTQEPGSTANVSVTYRNEGNRAEDVTLSPASQPAGVSVGLSPAAFTIQPGASQQVRVTVGIPSTRAPGPLPIQVEHKLSGGQDGTGTSTLSISVVTKRSVDFDPDGATSVGVSLGSQAAFRLDAVNLGNTAESGALRVTGAPSGWSVDVDPDRVDLSPGERQNVSVTVRPPAGAAQLAQATVLLEGPAGASQELTATVGASFGVRLTVPAGVRLTPGVSGLVNATVHNEGNAPDTVVVRLGTLPTGWQGGFLSGVEQSFDLEPGQSGTVQVSLRPPEGGESDVPVQVTLTARSLGNPDQSMTKALLVTVGPASQTTTSSTSETGGNTGIPGPSAALAALALVAVAFLARRRTME